MPKLSKGQRIVLAASCIGLSWLMNALHTPAVYANAMMILAALTAGYPIGRNAVQALRYRVLGIELLVTIAVAGAISIGDDWEGAAVTLLFLVGSYLENRALEKTRSALQSLADLAPKHATVIRGEEEIQVDPEDVQVGEIVLVRPGERIAVDGTVESGAASVNQAAITGESLPVTKQREDSVFSGSIVEGGYLRVRAQQIGDNTLFSRILEMVEQAQESKAKTQRFLERFAKYYTPAIIALSFGALILTRDVKLCLTLLVIGCPGALVISAPVSIVAGIGNGARRGILIKGGQCLEKASRVQIVAFDKTGTLTAGTPTVTHVQAFDITDNELLQLTARAERLSEHHLAKAVVAAAMKAQDVEGALPSTFTAIAGEGVRAVLDGREILVGNRKLFASAGILVPPHVEQAVQSEESKGQSVVLVGTEEQFLGTISIADTIRPEAYDLVAQLKSLGVQRTVMLSGDNPRAAEAVANELCIDEVQAQLLPADKVSAIKRLQQAGFTVAMVGDGVNDAPALATSDVGIAMGHSGTEAAMETADIVLMSDHLDKVPYTLGLSRATVNNMRQNIYFAVIVVATLLVGVLLKSVMLASGMLIHELSVLFVILNAIRLIRYHARLSGNKACSTTPLTASKSSPRMVKFTQTTHASATDD